MSLDSPHDATQRRTPAPHGVDGDSETSAALLGPQNGSQRLAPPVGSQWHHVDSGVLTLIDDTHQVFEVSVRRGRHSGMSTFMVCAEATDAAWVPCHDFSVPSRIGHEATFRLDRYQGAPSRIVTTTPVVFMTWTPDRDI